jgi:hypothetical protein
MGISLFSFNCSGGHCQFSISFNDQDFVSVYTRMDDCFVGTGLLFNVPLPPNLPNCSNCTFAWSWVNKIGLVQFN